jgi:hypothetical protein
LQVRYGDAEVLTRDIFDLVRFIEDHRIVFGQNGAEFFVLQREVGEEEMVIDDDDVAFRSAAVHAGEEAVFEEAAFAAGAEIAACIDLGPGRAVFGELADLGAVACFGGGDPVFLRQAKLLRPFM